jgi:hypothetical protein
MIVYNLTDKTPLGRPPIGPQALRIFGKLIPPGGHAEFPDDSPWNKVSGWVYTGKISLDSVPAWYKQAHREASTAKKVAPTEKPKLVEPKVVVDVGVMQATITPGPDGELGTSDDETHIESKHKNKRRGKK